MTVTKRIIVLDAGHGGSEMAGGSSPNHATGPNGLMEKEVALDIALRMGGLLRGSADVVMTRGEDRNLSLSARAQMARERHADIFLSLHFGGDSGGVWISSQANRGSRSLAGRLLRSLSGLTGVQRLYERNLGVLVPSRHDPATAACLAELAPLHDRDQARRLEGEEYRNRIAFALADALREHLGPMSLSLDDRPHHGTMPYREAMEMLKNNATAAMRKWEAILTEAERRTGLGLIPKLPRMALERLDADKETYEVGERATQFTDHRKRMVKLTGPDMTWLFDNSKSAMDQIEDTKVRAKLAAQDWKKAVYLGKTGDSGPSLELFTEMAKLTPERRVPSLVAYHNVSSVVVKVPGTSYQLYPAARDAFVDARTAAAAARLPGVTTGTGVTLEIGSAFRSEETQKKIAEGNTNRYAVAGSNSAHTYGLAVDLNLSVPGLVITEISTAAMANIVAMYRTPAYKWMFLYGAEFGWFPYRNEPWHWEYNPVGFPAQFAASAKRP